MKEITKAKFINTWASEWDERTGWKVSEEYHKQFSEQLEYLINQEVVKRIADRMPSDEEITHEATDRYANKITGRVRSNLWAAFRKGAKWSRSRMIKISSSQKTEGGGE